MPEVLPPLRRNLELMPSPVPDRPGLLVRDPYGYTDTILIIPPAAIPCLTLFDGKHSDADLRALLVRLTGEIVVSDVVRHLVESLGGNGFLENDVFERLRDERQRAFAVAPARQAVHAGAAYPGEPDALRETLRRYLDGGPAAGGPASREALVGIAAPHVSLDGGWRSYRAAYGLLGPEQGERTFVILGTSHYGEPERFGLTRKPFVTPLGEAVVDLGLVDELAETAGPAAAMEDYCHSIEHSLEFQVVFLQHLYGAGVRIVPILFGPFARSLQLGGRPEDDAGVGRFLAALSALAEREGERLLWVLGVDMAHMGRRYGDSFGARAEQGPMAEVAERDRRRIERIAEGDAAGFWNLVQEGADDLKWCGASPLYSFLKAGPPCRGELLRYEQWNIDEESVVSFAGLAFLRARRGRWSR